MKTSSVAHPVPYSVGTMDLSQGQSGWPLCWPLAPSSANLNNQCSYTATPPYAFMTRTGTTACLLHLLIFIKRLNEIFCKFLHMTAILLHHRYTVWWNSSVSHLECIQDYSILLKNDKFLIIKLTHNIIFFKYLLFSRAHVIYW